MVEKALVQLVYQYLLLILQMRILMFLIMSISITFR